MLSILVPCYNEEPHVYQAFKEINKSLKRQKKINYEIIFINDGSKDKSLKLAKNLKKKNKKIIILNNKKNSGLGFNFFKGLKFSKGDSFILSPCDNSHSSSEISKILKYLRSDYDLITTYYLNRLKQNYFRHLFTSLYTPFLNFIYGTNFIYFNGLTLYRSNYLKN